MRDLGPSFPLAGLPLSGLRSGGCQRCDGSIVVHPLAGPPDVFPYGDGFALKIAELAVAEDGAVCVRPARELTGRQVEEVWRRAKALKDDGMSAISGKWTWDPRRGMWTTALCVRG